MLKTECPRCKDWVTLPFQTGATEVVCKACSEAIPIKDVHVSAGPFMIYRDVLTGSLIKYKRLLAEAEMEIDGLRKKEALTGTYGVSIKSLGIFINNLKELLDGCRFDPRHPLTQDIETEYLLDGRAYKGALVNISVTGVCLDTRKNSERTRLWSEISVRLSNEDKEFLIPGKIMWIGKTSLIGVKFSSVDDETREFLKAFITENSLLLGK
ncbi:MAG: PilZ domain-containing protein [Deltaproteobacteria bacterium]|nr:PilZ domain-containing protein [Deltaproteobacteria bacterium]